MWGTTRTEVIAESFPIALREASSRQLLCECVLNGDCLVFLNSPWIVHFTFVYILLHREIDKMLSFSILIVFHVSVQGSLWFQGTEVRCYLWKETVTPQLNFLFYRREQWKQEVDNGQRKSCGPGYQWRSGVISIPTNPNRILFMMMFGFADERL